MFLAINHTNWWTPRFDRGCILINLRKQYDAMLICSGGRHIDIACFGLLESWQRTSTTRVQRCGRMDKWIDGWIDGLMDGGMDG